METIGKYKKGVQVAKRPRTAYIFYCNEHRDQVLRENTGWTVPQVGKELGRMWRELTKDQKRRYEIMAEQDRARYRRERDTLEANREKVQPSNPVAPQSQPITPADMRRIYGDMQLNIGYLHQISRESQLSQLNREAAQLSQLTQEMKDNATSANVDPKVYQHMPHGGM